MSFSETWLKSRFLSVGEKKVFDPMFTEEQKNIISKYGIDVTNSSQPTIAHRFRLNFESLYNLLVEYTESKRDARELNFYVGFKRAVDKDLQDEIAEEIRKTDTSQIYFHGFYCFSAQVPCGKSKEDISFVFVSYNTSDEYSRGDEDPNVAFIPLVSGRFSLSESELVDMLSHAFAVLRDSK